MPGPLPARVEPARGAIIGGAERDFHRHLRRAIAHALPCGRAPPPEPGVSFRPTTRNPRTLRRPGPPDHFTGVRLLPVAGKAFQGVAERSRAQSAPERLSD